MENAGYWYGSALSASGSDAYIPPQAIPLSKKNDKWKRANLDAFERIGMRQFQENTQFNDIFRMIEGKMSYQELSDVIPRYGELEELLKGHQLDSYNLKHYDIIGIIINALAGELLTNNDKFTVSSNDYISNNEYIREKTDKLIDYIKVELDKEIEMKMLQMGINPNLTEDQFNDPEQYNAYVQEIQQRRAEMTPEQIDSYMSTNWKTVAAKWGNFKLEEDRINFNMDHMDRDNFIQYLASGRCFRHIRIGYDYYEPEVWDMRNTFFSKDIENKTGQEGDYIGRVHRFTRTQVVNRYASKLTAKQKEEILGSNNEYYSDLNFTGENISYKKMFESNFHRLQTVPFNGYNDYKFSLQIQDELGIPLGEKKIMNRNGDYETMPVMLPDLMSGYTGDWGLFNSKMTNLRNDIHIRRDLMKVTEVYWKSFKKIGYLTYASIDGTPMSTIVTEDILSEFLTDENIKKLKTKTLEEIDEEQEVNTVIWDYIPEIWQGVKISSIPHSNQDAEEAYYIDIKPCDLQIKGEGNIYNLRFPVAGLIGSGLGPILEPFQMSHNLAMNQLHNLLEKEIGMFFIFDIRFLPSEFKEWGDTTDTLLYMRDIAKDVGLVPVDSSKQNLSGGAQFNQFTSQNLSLTGQIRDRMDTAAYYKNLAFEQVGITPQRLGTPTEYVTAEGVKASQSASFSQTEKYFTTFSEFKRKALELQLCVAQYCQAEGIDLQLFYTQSDATQAFIKESDPDFPLRKLGLTPLSDSKRRKDLEAFKQYILNTNTIGTDELAMAELISSETMSEIIETSRNVRLRRQEDEQRQQQNAMEQIQAQAQQQRETEDHLWELEEVTNQRDRENRIDIASINAAGRAADKQSDADGFKFIESMTNSALEDRALANQASLKERELDVKEQKQRDDKALKLKEMSLKVQDLMTRRKISEDNKYIARINKN